jgi:hypothetical protein
MANGDPKKKAGIKHPKYHDDKANLKNLQDRFKKATPEEQAAAREHRKKHGSGLKLSGEKSAKEKYKEAGKKVDMVKDVAKNPYSRPKDTARDRARKASGGNTSGLAPQRGPRSEGKRGRGTGWAN